MCRQGGNHYAGKRANKKIIKTLSIPSRNSVQRVNMVTELKGIRAEARLDEQVCTAPQRYKILSPRPTFTISYPNLSYSVRDAP